MKLSICIPIYNFDIRELFNAILKEIKDDKIDAEIVLIDDASEEKFKQINIELQNEFSNLILLEKNIGRSRIRNLFLENSKGDYLLFLDCDARPYSKDFIKKYLAEINQNKELEVIYGNFKINSLFSKTLRNKYSLEREIFSDQKKQIFSVFKTVNFVIKRETFKKFPFDEELLNYGYEDFVFAKKMQLNGVKFLAINNPIIHFDNSNNEVFLDKTKIAINTLFQLSKTPENDIFIKDIKIFKMAKKIEKANLSSFFLFFYRLIEIKIKKI